MLEIQAHFNYLLDLVIDRSKKRGGEKEDNLDVNGVNVTMKSIKLRKRMFPQTASLLGRTL